MKIASGRVLDRLPAEETCLGAVFMAYSFDPAFFEDHVLRAVLRLTSDPVEQAERYHHEARRALQETPVAAIVDAAERRPGRRLPFDLLEVSDVVFHPKAVLLLYREQARLLIGSGNLTFSGYGGNTELFLCADLEYEDDTDASLLAAFDEHLGRVRSLARRPGMQLDLFREELQRRTRAVPSGSPAGNLALLDSTTGRIIDELTALLPDEAVITSVGMLAPFYERDDASELDVTSVFGALSPWTDKDTVLDVGVAWDNPQVHPSGISELEDGLGRLWSWTSESDSNRTLEHLVPSSIGPNTLTYIDDTGRNRRWHLEEVHEAIEERLLWMQPPPVAFAPQNAIREASKQFADVRLWLHPATRLVDGRPIHRPLHAKLLVISFRVGRSTGTLALMGSANMSRRALLMPASPGQGNVELCCAFRIDSSLTLRDFVPELVHAPASVVELKEREFPELGHNYALAIDEATHDPRQSDLRVTWSSDANNLANWRLAYDGKELARSHAAPSEPLVVDDFVLQPSTAEVILHVDGKEYPVPILVTDLVALPAAPMATSVGLDELLMLLGRRIGTERAIQIAERRASNGEHDDLFSFFGEGFGPTDVFRAWWSVAEDLMDPTLSVSAFRLRLEGALGVGAAWKCMLDALAEGRLPVEEVWFYGAEMLRELGEAELQPTDDREAKNEVLSVFCERIRRDLRSIGLDVETRPWVKRILSFYKEEQP